MECNVHSAYLYLYFLSEIKLKEHLIINLIKYIFHFISPEEWTFTVQIKATCCYRNNSYRVFLIKCTLAENKRRN